MIDTITVQKQALDEENEDLKRRIEYLENSQIDLGVAASGARQAGVNVPGLNLSADLQD